MSFPSYAGIDLVPLPYESALGSLLRFGWRNRMNLTMLAPVCSISKRSIYPSKLCYETLDWLSTEQFESISTWRIPSVEEKDFCSAFKKDHHIWLSSTFRYCPLCLEMGYHSFVHQFLGISCCPLHRAQLSTDCHSCGCHLPSYQFQPQLFLDPLMCRCGEPVSGVELSLELDEILRLQEDTLAFEFKTVFDWCLQSSDLRNRLSSVQTAHRDLSETVRSFGNVKSLIRDACFSLMRPCFTEIQSLNQKSALIQWNAKALGNWEFEQASMPKELHSNDTNRSVEVVYRSSLRTIVNWIKREEGIDDKELVALARTQGSRVSDFNPKVLAFMCMRAQLEVTAWHFIPDDFSSRIQVGLREPNVLTHYHENRSLKSAWRAFFLGFYASWFVRVKNSKIDTTSTLFFHPDATSNDILMFSDLLDIDGSNYWAGGILLPALDFLSKPPFFSNASIASTISTKNHKEALVDSTQILPPFDPTIDEFLTHFSTHLKKGISDNYDKETDCRRYIERFAVWAYVTYRKWPAELNDREIRFFIAFLENMQPSGYWSSSSTDLWPDRWHPFTRVPSSRLIGLAVFAVNLYYQFIQRDEDGTVKRKALWYVRTWSQPTLPINLEQWKILTIEMTKFPVGLESCLTELAVHLLFELELMLKKVIEIKFGQLRVLNMREGGDRYGAILAKPRLSDRSQELLRASLNMRNCSIDYLSPSISEIHLFDLALVEDSLAGSPSLCPITRLDKSIRITFKTIAAAIHQEDPALGKLFKNSTPNSIKKSGKAVRLSEADLIPEIKSISEK